MTRYHMHERSEMVPFIPRTATSVLDVGCGAGRFGVALRRTSPDIRLVGVEAVSEAAHAASDVYDEVLTGHFPEIRPPGQFDCICFLDVLEHMIDPWEALVSARTHLTPQGVVVASLPNVRYWPVLKNLALRGRWDYADAGVMDRSHLRWFTRSTILETFVISGYDVERVESVSALPMGREWSLLRLFWPSLVEDLATQQYAVVARPSLQNPQKMDRSPERS